MIKESLSKDNLASIPVQSGKPAFGGLASFEERLAVRGQETLNFSNLQKKYVKKMISQVFDTESLKF